MGLAFHSMAPPPSPPVRHMITTMAPNTAPRYAPAPMPYIAVPTMIGTMVSVMEKGPKWMKVAITCNTMTTAVIMPSPTSRSVLSLTILLFFFIR